MQKKQIISILEKQINEKILYYWRGCSSFFSSPFKNIIFFTKNFVGNIYEEKKNCIVVQAFPRYKERKCGVISVVEKNRTVAWRPAGKYSESTTFQEAIKELLKGKPNCPSVFSPNRGTAWGSPSFDQKIKGKIPPRIVVKEK